jgi:hypothetical protein
MLTQPIPMRSNKAHSSLPLLILPDCNNVPDGSGATGSNSTWLVVIGDPVPRLHFSDYSIYQALEFQVYNRIVNCFKAALSANLLMGFLGCSVAIPQETAEPRPAEIHGTVLNAENDSFMLRGVLMLSAGPSHTAMAGKMKFVDKTRRTSAPQQSIGVWEFLMRLINNGGTQLSF